MGSLPGTVEERIFAMGALVFTFMASVGFVSTITTTMTRLQVINRQYTHKFLALGRYLSHQLISRELTEKIERNAQHALNENVGREDQVDLLALISEPLRTELHFEMHSPVLLGHPFFHCFAEANPTGARKLCHQAVKRLYFSPGDVVFDDCEAIGVPAMLFIVSGSCSYVRADKPPELAMNGSWFAEAALWTHWTHRGVLRAVTECQMLRLGADQFQSIVSAFPSLSVRIYSKEFVRLLSATKIDDLTDLSTDDETSQWLVKDAFDSVPSKSWKGKKRSTRGKGSGTRKTSGTWITTATGTSRVVMGCVNSSTTFLRRTVAPCDVVVAPECPLPPLGDGVLTLQNRSRLTCISDDDHSVTSSKRFDS